MYAPGMGEAMHVLLSGFEPFGGRGINTSEQLVQRVTATEIPGVRVTPIILPVRWDDGAARLLDAIGELTPDVVLCLGESGVADRLLIERQAVNATNNMRDNADAVASDGPIHADAPEVYSTSLPHDSLVAAIESAGCPAATSDNMGRYLCNHVMFAVLHEHSRAGRPDLAGFIHVPALTDGQDDQLERFTRGLQAAINSLT